MSRRASRPDIESYGHYDSIESDGNYDSDVQDAFPPPRRAWPGHSHPLAASEAYLRTGRRNNTPLPEPVEIQSPAPQRLGTAYADYTPPGPSEKNLSDRLNGINRSPPAIPSAHASPVSSTHSRRSSASESPLRPTWNMSGTERSGILRPTVGMGGTRQSPTQRPSLRSQLSTTGGSPPVQSSIGTGFSGTTQRPPSLSPRVRVPRTEMTSPPLQYRNIRVVVERDGYVSEEDAPTASDLSDDFPGHSGRNMTQPPRPGQEDDLVTALVQGRGGAVRPSIRLLPAPPTLPFSGTFPAASTRPAHARRRRRLSHNVASGERSEAGSR